MALVLQPRPNQHQQESLSVLVSFPAPPFPLEKWKEGLGTRLFQYHAWEGMWSWSLQDNHGTATGRSETLHGLARKWLSKVFATNIKVIDWWKLCFIIPFQSSRLLDSQWFRAFLVLLNFAIGGHLDPLIGLLLVAWFHFDQGCKHFNREYIYRWIVLAEPARLRVWL